MYVPERDEVLLDETGLPSVLLELPPVLIGMELELELPMGAVGPTSVLLLTVGMYGGYGYGAGPGREEVVLPVECGTEEVDGETGLSSVEEDELPVPGSVMVELEYVVCVPVMVIVLGTVNV